jgi:cytochrome c oxidase subunit 3/cytochrome o ubiquinol oxidase subunit 3
MSTPSLDIHIEDPREDLPPRGPVAMYCVIGAEVAMFTIFLVAYIFYIGKSLSGPQPRDVLHTPIFLTICLLSSSLTIHFAVRSLGIGKMSAFGLWWSLTIALGTIFLLGTLREWRQLIYADGLTIGTNLFGTTYYSLVGLHAFHVTAGLLALTTVLVFTFRGDMGVRHVGRAEVLSMYWHFVDVVWVVVFTVVYIIGR